MKRITFGTGILFSGYYTLNSTSIQSRYNQSKSLQMNLLTRFNKFLSYTNYNTNAYCDEEEQPKLPYLGLSIRSLIDKPGMTIILVNSESPAAIGGLKVGDVLIKINDQEVNRIEEYYTSMGKVKKGEMIEIIVERYHEHKTIKLRV
mmetsp:Transcript_19038/g.21361  ORF Transcript_19038/g.21361 Transcript_19038/m.21361 type:complete len:147 (+) Transcript_19038:24-464(+)